MEASPLNRTCAGARAPEVAWAVIVTAEALDGTHVAEYWPTAGSESVAVRAGSPLEKVATTWALVTALAQSSITVNASGTGQAAGVRKFPGCPVCAIPSLEGVQPMVALRSDANFAPAGSTTSRTLMVLKLVTPALTNEIFTSPG